MTVGEALTCRRFYHQALLFFLGMFFGLYMASVYKFAAEETLDDKSLTVAGAIGSVCNGGSRVFWASL